MIQNRLLIAAVTVSALSDPTFVQYSWDRSGGGTGHSWERPDERSQNRDRGFTPLPDTSVGRSYGVYNSEGRRTGTIEPRSYGGAVIYDNEGRRRGEIRPR